MRFLHVVGAVVWLGGQLTVSALVMPVACDRLPPEARAGLMRVLGMRFGIATVAVLIPLQVATGVALARHKGVTVASLAEPGYGRMLAGKLVAFALVMLAAGLHGWAVAAGRRTLARSLAVSSPDGCSGWSRAGLTSLGHSGCGGQMPCHDVAVSRNDLSQLSSRTPHSGCRVCSHRELPGLVLSLSSSVRAGHVTSSAPKVALLEVVVLEQIVSRPLT